MNQCLQLRSLKIFNVDILDACTILWNFILCDSLCVYGDKMINLVMKTEGLGNESSCIPVCPLLCPFANYLTICSHSETQAIVCGVQLVGHSPLSRALDLFFAKTF